MEKELLENGGSLVKTSAGSQLNNELSKLNANLRLQLEELRQEQNKQDGEIKALVDEKKALELKLKNIEREKERLKTPQVSISIISCLFIYISFRMLLLVTSFFF